MSLGTVTADAQGAWTLTSPVLAEGVYQISAAATNAAGTVLTSASALSLTIDTTQAPPNFADLLAETDYGVSDNDNITSTGRLDIAGTAPGAVSASILVHGPMLNVAVSVTDGRWAFSLPYNVAMPETLTLYGTASDAAGNISALSPALLVITWDLVSPGVPTIALSASSDNGRSQQDGITSIATPVFEGTAEAGGVVSVRVGGVEVGTAPVDAGGNWSYTSDALTDGAHIFSVKGRDVAGNRSGASADVTVTVDTTPPAAPVLAGPASPTNARTLVLTGTGEPGAIVTLLQGANAAGTPVEVDGAGRFTISIPAPATDGSYEFSALQTDVAGLRSPTSTSVTVVFDQSVPAAPVITGLAPEADSGVSSTDSITNETRPILIGTAEPNNSVELFQGQTSLGIAAATVGGEWRLTAPALIDAAHQITATQTDAAGNVSPVSAAYTVTIDTTPPAAPNLPDLNASSDSGIASDDNITNATAPVITGIEQPDLIVELFSNVAQSLGRVSTDGNGGWSLTLGALAEGAHQITARTTDAAGNVSPPSQVLPLTLDTTAPPTPAAPALEPGTAANDTTPTLTGTGVTGDLVTISLSGLGVLGTTEVDGTGTWRFTPQTPLANGQHDLTITVADRAGNSSGASGALGLVIDATVPTLALSTPATSPHSGVFTVTATFSEAVTGFDLSDVSVGNGAASGFLALSTSRYSFDVTPSADGAVTVDVAAGSAQDTAGNDATAAAQLSVTTDGTVPTLALSTPATSPHSGVFTVTATFSEAVTGFDLSDVSVGNGAASGFLALSTSRYSFDVTPSADGAVTVDVAAGSAQDTAGNDATAAAQLSVTTDGATPVLVLSTPDDTVNGPFTVTATFSEGVEAFSLAHFVADNGTLSDFLAQSSSLYTFDVAPLAEGDVGLSITPGARFAHDRAGNWSEHPSPLTIAYDVTPPPAPPPIKLGPEPDVEGSTTTNDPTPQFSGTSEPDSLVTVFLTGGTASVRGRSAGPNGSTVLGTTVSDSVGNWVFTAPDPIPDGMYDIAVTVTDDAGNVSDAGPILTFAVDATPPDLALSTDAVSPHSGAFDVTATFSEDVTGFEVTDLVLVNGRVSQFTAVSAQVYTFTVTPEADGVVSLDVPAAVAQDLFENDNTAAEQLSLSTDTGAPGLTLSTTATSPFEGAFVVTATFTEDVTGFELADVVVANGTASIFSASSPQVYSFTVTPDTDGLVSVDVAAGAAQDGARNLSTAATQLGVSIDTTAPSVVLTGPSDTVTGPFVVTAMFDEDVTGLEQSEISVSNGTLTGFSGSGALYSLSIDPVLGQVVSVSIAAGVAQDALGHLNTVSNVFSVQAGSPVVEFDAHRDEIRQIVADQALRTLQSTVAANREMVTRARTRFMLGRRGSELPTRSDVPFDIDGTAQISNGVLSTQGTFYGLRGIGDGGIQRIVFGDFDLRRDTDGTVHAQFSGRVAWERQASAATMIGYFVGGEYGRDTIEGAFSGRNDGYGLSAGAYFVSELRRNLYTNGYVSLGVGRNNLSLSNGILDLSSSFDTQSLSLGFAMTGVVERSGYEIWPELAFDYGHTNIGLIGFTGSAYGVTDDRLMLDAGGVSVASLSFAPEVRVPLDGNLVDQSNRLLTFAPRVSCEYVRAVATRMNCGGGAEIGVAFSFEEGLSQLDAGLSLEVIGGQTRTGMQINFERNF